MQISTTLKTSLYRKTEVARVTIGLRDILQENDYMRRSWKW